MQFSQLTVGIRSDVPGSIGLRYCDPIIGAPPHVLRVIQTCAWEPLRNVLDVSLVQGLRDNAYAVCIGKLRKESGPWLVTLISKRNSHKVRVVIDPNLGLHSPSLRPSPLIGVISRWHASERAVVTLTPSFPSALQYSNGRAPF